MHGELLIFAERSVEVQSETIQPGEVFLVERPRGVKFTPPTASTGSMCVHVGFSWRGRTRCRRFSMSKHPHTLIRKCALAFAGNDSHVLVPQKIAATCLVAERVKSA